MRRAALAFALAVLMLAPGARAQGPEGYYDFENPMKLPKGEMTVGDVIDILTEYSVVHQTKIAGGDYWGVTRVATKEIFLSDEPDLGSRRDAVLHELYHAFYARIGIQTGSPQGEAAVYLKTHRHLVNIFQPVEDEDEK